MTARLQVDAGAGAELEPKQLRAIAELMAARTVEEAAKRAGVGERTLRRWLTQPHFRRAYKGAQRTAFEHATARLQDITSLAVQTLEEMLRDEKTPPAVRMSGVKVALEAAARGIELGEVAERVDALEREMAVAPEAGSSLRRH